MTVPVKARPKNKPAPVVLNGWVALQLWYEDEGWLVALVAGGRGVERWGLLTDQAETSEQAITRLSRLLGVRRLDLEHDAGIWTGKVRLHHYELDPDLLPPVEPDGDGRDPVEAPRIKPDQKSQVEAALRGDAKTGTPNPNEAPLMGFEIVCPTIGRGGVVAGRCSVNVAGRLSFASADLAALDATDTVVLWADASTRSVALSKPKAGQPPAKVKTNDKTGLVFVSINPALKQMQIDQKAAAGAYPFVRREVPGHGTLLVVTFPEPEEDSK